MAEKKLTGTMTVTFQIVQTGGDTPETLNGLEQWAEEEWAGLEVWFQDPDQDEETVVELEVSEVKVT